MTYIVVATALVLVAFFAPCCILSAYRQGWQDGNAGRANLAPKPINNKEKERTLTEEEKAAQEKQRRIDKFRG